MTFRSCLSVQQNFSLASSIWKAMLAQAQKDSLIIVNSCQLCFPKRELNSSTSSVVVKARQEYLLDISWTSNENKTRVYQYDLILRNIKNGYSWSESSVPLKMKRTKTFLHFQLVWKNFSQLIISLVINIFCVILLPLSASNAPTTCSS